MAVQEPTLYIKHLAQWTTNPALATHLSPEVAGVVTRKLRPSCCVAGESSSKITLPTPASVMFLAICRQVGVSVVT